MGYKQNVQLNSGLSVTEAYHRLDSYVGGKTGVTVYVNAYVSQQAYLDGKVLLIQKPYTFIPNMDDNAENIMRQGYADIKTRPENANIVDVLEEGQSL